MKNRNILSKHSLNAIAIGFLASSSLVMAANYDTLNQQDKLLMAKSRQPKKHYCKLLTWINKILTTGYY
jgi:hypothetical protein